MPEKTKRIKDLENTAAKEIAEIDRERQESNVKDTWSADQQEKSYYYDDSYGYEVYNADDDEDEGNDERAIMNDE